MSVRRSRFGHCKCTGGLVTALVLLAGAAAGAHPASARTAPVAHQAVVGGEPAPAGRYPWMAALLLDAEGTIPERFNCGGSLIAPTIVLTAAHCAVEGEGDEPLAPNRLQVILGRVGLQDAGGEVLDVTRVEVDPDYSPKKISHDVALLQLASPSTARPVALGDAKLGLREGQRSTILGWGRTSKDGPISEQLLTADVPLWSNARCGTRYKQLHDPGLMLCAATPRGGQDICQGDSGGPLLVSDRSGATKLVGVTSWNIPCARPRLPGNFAWVASPHHLGWIIRKGNAMVRGDQDVDPPRIANASAEGRRVRFSLEEAAQVVVTVDRLSGAGTRQFPTALVQNSRAGANAFQVPRALRGAQLPAGRYSLELVATDRAGNRSAPRQVRLSLR